MNGIGQIKLCSAILCVLIVFYLCRDVTEQLKLSAASCADFVPYKSQVKYPVKQGAVFISIASYRDDECKSTVKSIFDEAKWPDRVYLGICQQNKEQKEDCFNCLKRKAQIKTIRMEYTDAKGPTYARYWCATLWRGEEYFLQIDSHTTFQKDWDEKLITMLNQCDSSKPVLSAYPATKSQLKIEGVPSQCNGKWDSNGVPTWLAGWIKQPPSKPPKSAKPSVAGGMMFLHGSFLYEVPFDPNLSFLFQAEEVLFSARLWTHGYDIYTPIQKVMIHNYGRKGSPKFWNDNKSFNFCQQKALKRAKYLLGLEQKKSLSGPYIKDLNQYGMGKKRTLTAYWKEAGISVDNKTVSDDC